jgi:hypothetical protein
LQWRDLEGQRSPQCLPVGGQSSWGIIPSTASSSTATVNTAIVSATAATAAADRSNSGTSGGSSSDSQKPLVLVTAAMDSTSMFHDRSVTEYSFFWSFKVFSSSTQVDSWSVPSSHNALTLS